MGGLVVIDFGSGNVGSMVKALRKVGAAPVLAADPDEVRAADRLVFPGVGHFGAAMAEVARRGVDVAVREAVAQGTPTLAVCIGLQVLFEGSEEAPGVRGLGILGGACRRFEEARQGEPTERRKVPQIGWNEVRPAPASRLFVGIPTGSSFYFVHSYYAVPTEAGVIAATTDYGVEYCCAVERGRLAAVQFHPEKSGPLGLKLLENFLAL